MNDPSVFRAIQLLARPVFQTREIAALRGTSVGAASQALKALERRGVLLRAARGIWCVPADPRFSRFQLVSYLNGSHRAYVSFVSALHLHGTIDQIPHVVYAATTAHSHVETTPVGVFSYHQLTPEFFGGFDWYRDESTFLLASAEKALVDSLYLSTRKGRRFGTLPELDLGPPFDVELARSWVERISDERIRKLLSRALLALLREGEGALAR